MRISDWSSDVCSSDLNLRGGRRELLDAADGEPAVDQRVQGGPDPAVILPHALGEPVRPALPLDGVAIDGPGPAAVFVAEPARMRRGHVDRMLDGENEMGARHERALHRSHKPPEILDVMKGEQIGRAEEHTSELQSLMRISYAVFCLKKKNTPTTRTKERRIPLRRLHQVDTHPDTTHHT